MERRGLPRTAQPAAQPAAAAQPQPATAAEPKPQSPAAAEPEPQPASFLAAAAPTSSDRRPTALQVVVVSQAGGPFLCTLPLPPSLPQRKLLIGQFKHSV